MEWNFNIPPYIYDWLKRKPELIVVWAAFGTPLVLGIFSIFLKRFKKNGMLYRWLAYIIAGLGITWIIGFVTSMILLFSGVEGVKIAICWVILFIGYCVFATFNYESLRKLINDSDLRNLKIRGK